MWKSTIRWGPALSIRKTTNIVSLVLKGNWSSVGCYLWIQGLNFERLRGENYYCYLIDTYLVNKIIHKFSKVAFERLNLKERIFLRQFLNCPTKWNISSVVQTIINGLTSQKYFIHEGKFHCLLLKQLFVQFCVCLNQECVLQNFEICIACGMLMILWKSKIQFKIGVVEVTNMEMRLSYTRDICSWKMQWRFSRWCF